MKFPDEPPRNATPDRNSPDSATFEVWGYFVEVWDSKRNQLLGTRRVAQQVGRACGGLLEHCPTMNITEPFEVQRGHKRSLVKASTAKPVAVATRYYPICGRMLSAY